MAGQLRAQFLSAPAIRFAVLHDNRGFVLINAATGRATYTTQASRAEQEQPER
jgi:hypothetical protein